MKTKLLPASFFALTLGLAETGNAWRFAHKLWALPPLAGEVLQALAILSFLAFGALYLHKWMAHRAAAAAETRDPVQSAFLALIPESVILIALALQPYTPTVAAPLFWIGSAANLAYGAWRLAANWSRQREAAQIVPPLYLPYTASILVNALAAGIFGYTDYGWMLFGIGGISWLILDSSITHQLMSGGLADKTRNFMGIYSAPPVVALVAYQVLSGPDASTAVMYALAGYALFVFAALALAMPWLGQQDFAPGYWAYTFGLATLAQGLMLMSEQVHNAILETVAAAAFGATLLLVLYVAWGSLRLLSRGAYLPTAPAAPVVAGRPS
ncbi:dicarboxylate transporter/tellurite-resistance protein TehA [Duganella callida]|uniref:Dicarboxylate transporter/tellurite-resistance protein TehA n=1 Tax=Duganella callida TaxID=2561932 RepID=A0A4Y9SHI5_9BURK|nr:dicarboxylate transporter/tellurite-resistance protein TehA [Duganella callida]TFW24194.1 dicarboxylate transporter/tellurite-resistance protein TehA [Duganella callida]